MALFRSACILIVVLLLQQSKTSAGYFTTNSTILESAVSIGAVCLDGSPPAYLFGPGFGEGTKMWLVYLLGGEWCSTIHECTNRKTSHLGSSSPQYWNDSKFDFKGILDFNRAENPDFYNWNKVAVRYCDGSSFTGDVESVDPTTGLHFRGKRIFDAVVDELLVNKGMKDATHVFLTGGSAGGLSVIIHCDRFSNRFPKRTTVVKCLSDGGFFLRSKHPAQSQDLESKFRGIVDLHNSTALLSKACKNRMKYYLCFFPQYFAKDIQTPLFIMLTPYDSYQMNHTLSTHFYFAVKLGHISATQYKTLKELRLQVLEALHDTDTPSRGLFVSNCFFHTQTIFYWNQRQHHGFEVNHRKDAEVVGGWYFDRTSRVQEVDQNALVKDCPNNKYYIEEGA